MQVPMALVQVRIGFDGHGGQGWGKRSKLWFVCWQCEHNKKSPFPVQVLGGVLLRLEIAVRCCGQIIEGYCKTTTVRLWDGENADKLRG